MSEPDDVLGKLDALIKRHQPASEPEIPVLTDVVLPPELDLDAIPMLTDVVQEESAPEEATAAVAAEVTPLPQLDSEEFVAPPTIDLESEQRETPIPDTAPEEVELPSLEFELPPDVAYVSLVESEQELPRNPEAELPLEPQLEPQREPPPALQALPPSAPQALSEETIRHIADIIRDDVARVLDVQLQQALAQQLQSSLHVALDRALSSMLDQFITTIEEVVRASIADELQKQLAPFKRPKPPA